MIDLRKQVRIGALHALGLLSGGTGRTDGLARGAITTVYNQSTTDTIALGMIVKHTTKAAGASAAVELTTSEDDVVYGVALEEIGPQGSGLVAAMAFGITIATVGDVAVGDSLGPSSTAGRARAVPTDGGSVGPVFGRAKAATSGTSTIKGDISSSSFTSTGPNPELCIALEAEPDTTPSIMDSYGNAAGGDSHHLLANQVPSGAGGLVFTMMTDTGRIPTFATYQPTGAGGIDQAMTLISTTTNPVAPTNSAPTTILVWWLELPAAADANGRISFDGAGGGVGLGAHATESSEQPTVIGDYGNSDTAAIDASAVDDAARVMVVAGWRTWSIGGVGSVPSAITAELTDDWTLSFDAANGQSDICWYGGNAIGGRLYEIDVNVATSRWVAVAIYQAGTPGAVTVNDGHPDLVNPGSDRASHCGHRHDVHRDTAPTVDDDWETAGYPVGTTWAQLDSLVAPTEIVGLWISVDSTAGAAVWLNFGGLTASEVQALIDALVAADIPYDNSSSGLTAVELQAAVDELAALVASAGARWHPVMAHDPDDGRWHVVVDGSGTAVMAEAP